MPDTQSGELTARMAPLIELMRNFCITLENAAETEEPVLTAEMLDMLPRLYLAFGNLDTDMLIYGEHDTYLDTMEADMKYSDTPIAASISENLADIFQPLYDCVSAIRESEGMQTAVALTICHENFRAYWSQRLCNVLRPLNQLRYNPESL